MQYQIICMVLCIFQSCCLACHFQFRVLHFLVLLFSFSPSFSGSCIFQSTSHIFPVLLHFQSLLSSNNYTLFVFIDRNFNHYSYKSILRKIHLKYSPYFAMIASTSHRRCGFSSIPKHKMTDIDSERATTK